MLVWKESFLGQYPLAITEDKWRYIINQPNHLGYSVIQYNEKLERTKESPFPLTIEQAKEWCEEEEKKRSK